MRKFLKNQEGFTLVELMVVVAIIGVLSAVAVPQFKVYQAKAKQSEAKVSLAAVYTAEVSSQSDYDTFATCLDFLGYEKPNQGYYRVGFNADFGNAQVQSKTGGGATSCPTGGTYVDPTTVLKVGSGSPSVANATITQVAFTAVASGSIAAGSKLDEWRMTNTKALTNNTNGTK